MITSHLLEDLRRQPFYRGQILRVDYRPGSEGELVDPKTIMERCPRLKGGSLLTFLGTLGMERIPRSLASGLERAFGSDALEDGRGADTICVAPFSSSRELFWKLVAFLDSLDEARTVIVLCHNAPRRERVFSELTALANRADVRYAVDLVQASKKADLAPLAGATAAMLVISPEQLFELVADPELATVRDTFLAGLGRVILPAFHEWPPATLSHTSYALRQLHVECAMRGVLPSVVGTCDPAENVEAVFAEFFSRPVPSASFQHFDTVESCPCTLAFYSGAMERDATAPAKWKRQDLAQAGKVLVDWLVGHHIWPAEELHYVLDVSGSMADSLSKVGEAIVKDYEARRDAGELTEDCVVKLTTFHTQAELKFTGAPPDDIVSALEKCLGGLKVEGATDLGCGLLSALEESVGEARRAVRIVLLSDGYGDVSEDARARMLELVLHSRSKGFPVDVLYILLDMDPPVVVRNLISHLGGRIAKETIHSLSMSGFDKDRSTGSHVLVLSGEKGLGESIAGAGGGKRKVVCCRGLADLSVEPTDIFAVVVTGKFHSATQIRDHLRHLGVGELPAFVLTDAEAWSRQLAEDYVEGRSGARVLHMSSGNSHVHSARLQQLVRLGEVSPEGFAYLSVGAPHFDSFLQSISRPARQTDAPEVPAGYRAIRRSGRWMIAPATRASTQGIKPPLATFSDQAVRLSGEGIDQQRDSAASPLIFHQGAVLDAGPRSAQVGAERDGILELLPRSTDRAVPIVSGLEISWARGQASDSRVFSGLGAVEIGETVFSVAVSGVRTYERANLDNRFIDESFSTPQVARFETTAVCWQPKDAGPEQVAGLANILRICLGGVFRYADLDLAIFPDLASGCVWIADMAPGGNGCARAIFEQNKHLRMALQLGARMALDCPCEGGLAGASTQEAPKEEDAGCPRCVRTIGPVLLDIDGNDVFRAVSKKATLEWLHDAGLSGSAAVAHMKEKFVGVDDMHRIVGSDDGSRRGMLPHIRQLLADRLGLTIDDHLLASSGWLPPGEVTVLGVYSPSDNLLKVVRGMKEWRMLDVIAHELFHNYQHQVQGLFNFAKLGREAEPQPPFEGKLFIEAAAMWAESHVVDALAIRTALELANLRQGDEYGAGFQIFKWIEEGSWDPEGSSGGIEAVLEFMRTGDIAAITGGKVRDLGDLYRKSGVSDRLRAMVANQASNP